MRDSIQISCYIPCYTFSSGKRSMANAANPWWPALGFSSTEPIVLFPAIHFTIFFKIVLFGQRHLIEGVFHLAHGVRSRLHRDMHLMRRALSHRSQSRLDGLVSPTVVHRFHPDVR